MFNINNVRVENGMHDIRKLFHFYDPVIIKEYSRKELERRIKKDIPDWVVATTIDNQIVLLDEIKSFDFKYVEKIILHEFVHIAMEQYIANSCPLFFYEGIAMYYAGQKEVKVEIEELRSINFEELDYSNKMLYLYAFNLIEILMKNIPEKTVMDKIKEKDYIFLENVIRKSLFNEEKNENN